MRDEAPLSTNELDELEARVGQATPGPWRSWVEGKDHESGSSFIETAQGNIELSGASVTDQDFIALAREAVPRLLAEVRRAREAERQRGHVE